MADHEVTRRLAAILAADVAGYSRLVGDDEEGTIARLRSVREDVIDPCVARDHGRIVKTMGDGLLIEFPSVVDAVRNAIAIQRAMAERNAELPEEQRLEFRVGINLGDIVIDGDDILGDGVNIAARLEGLAEPGGIAVSNRVFEDVRDRFGETFTDGGEQVLKNISRPVRVFHWLPEGGAKTKTPAGARPARLSPRVRWAAASVAVVAIAAASWWWVARTPDTTTPTTKVSQSAPKPGTVSPRTTARTSIVVLPFVNQSGDPSQDYFSDGVTEDLIAALGRFPSLAVIGRNAAFSYKGKTVKSADIRRDLGVRFIVEGSVRRAGKRIRVSAQLSDATSGNLLWSQKYDRAFDDLFAVQDSITRQVAGALAANLSRIEQKRAASKPTDSLDAYDLVLRGRGLLRLVTRAANRRARALFERAIEIDPRYAAAYAELGNAYVQVTAYGWSEDLNAALDRAQEYGQKALAIDPDNVAGLAVVSHVHSVRGRYLLSLSASDRALAINPSNARSMRERASVLLWLGRIPDAIAAGETALRFDPNPPAGSIVIFAIAYYQAKRHEDAVRLLERGILRYPNRPLLYAVLAASYGQMGRKEEAARALAQLRRLSPFFNAQSFGSRFRNRAHQAYLIEGLTKAGLK